MITLLSFLLGAALFVVVLQLWVGNAMARDLVRAKQERDNAIAATAVKRVQRISETLETIEEDKKPC